MAVEQTAILFPFVMSLPNYRAVEEFLSRLNNISIGNKIMALQCGFDDDNYVVIFYINKKPTRDTIEYLARNNPKIDHEKIQWVWE
jgi:hypothetical protein